MRLVRHERIRQKLRGTSNRPRLALFRSLNHIYVQIIDDERGHTLVAASSLDPEVKANGNGGGKGKVSARRAKESGISRVVFDTGGYKYHGRVKALAEAAREGGLDF
ncbi:50S ribosomal protein L18 [Geodia barretti]|nr:50S ribosomal protein L18 [Geodia barretti]